MQVTSGDWTGFWCLGACTFAVGMCIWSVHLRGLNFSITYFPILKNLFSM